MTATITLRLPRDVATQLLDLLRTAIGDPVHDHLVESGLLADDDEAWSLASGAHRGREWITDDAAADREAATEFYRRVKKKARVFIDLLVDNAGVRLTADEICARRPDAFGTRSAIAGAINGLRLPCHDADRRYPFEWWEGTGGKSTEYAMRQSVAALLRSVRDDSPEADR